MSTLMNICSSSLASTTDTQHAKSSSSASDLISAMHAISAASASPWASAGCSLPASATCSITDTHPMNTKKAVPTSSATHGWKSRSNSLGTLASCCRILSIRAVSMLWSFTLSSAILSRLHLQRQRLRPNSLLIGGVGCSVTFKGNWWLKKSNNKRKMLSSGKEYILEEIKM